MDGMLFSRCVLFNNDWVEKVEDWPISLIYGEAHAEK
jgi:hypothetical protein